MDNIGFALFLNEQSFQLIANAIFLLIGIAIGAAVRYKTGNIGTKPSATESCAEPLRNDIEPINKMEHSPALEKKWIVVGATEAGLNKIPCQDAHALSALSDGCGVAVCCDGAGTRENSHHGAQFVSKSVCRLLEDVVTNNGWQLLDTLPSPGEWRDISEKVIKIAATELHAFSEETGYSVDSMACTLIAVIYSVRGLLIAHIGDGRGGYQDSNGQWKAFLVPVSGTEAGMTEFITSRNVMDLAEIIHSHVILDEVAAFTIMTDGFEQQAFETGDFDTDKPYFIKKNLPHKLLLDRLASVLRNNYQSGTKYDEIQGSWVKYVREGTQRSRDEPDDKTMILGVLVD